MDDFVCGKEVLGLKIWFKRVPYLIGRERKENREIEVPLFGDIFLKVGDERYCLLCEKELKGEENRICWNCMSKSEGIRFSCITEGQKKIFKRVCSFEKPLCLSEKNRKICFGSHLVYIGFFGDLTKVGVTREERKREDGIFLRHIEQGLDFVIVFKFKKRVSLIDAQELEIAISRVLKIPCQINFNEKVMVLNRPIFRKFEKIATRLIIKVSSIAKAAKIDISSVNFFDLRDKYILPRNLLNMKIIGIDSYNELRGSVIGFKGSILLLKKNKNEIYAVNGDHLIGRVIKTFVKEGRA